MFNDSDIDLFKPANNQFPIFFELIPPEKGNKEKRLQQHTECVDYLLGEIEVDAFNLPEIQDESPKGENGKRRNPHKERISPRSYVRNLSQRYDAEFIINRVIVKQPHEVQEEWLLETHNEFDIQNVILVGGESSKIQYPGPSVPDGNSLAKDYLNSGRRRYAGGEIEPTDFTIGNICIPTRRKEDFDEPERMLKKVQTGADFFTSQIIAEAQSPVSLLKDFSNLLIEERQTPPVIFWSFSPIAEKKDVDFLRWLGVHIPSDVEEKILGSDDPASTSIDLAQRIWEKIHDFNNQLPLPIPMGINISVMGLRNFKNGVDLAKKLIETEIPYLEDDRVFDLENGMIVK